MLGLIACSSESGGASGADLSFEQKSAALLTAADLPEGFSATVITASQAAQPLPSDLAREIATSAPTPCKPRNDLESMLGELLSVPSVRFTSDAAPGDSQPALTQSVYAGPKAKQLFTIMERTPKECARWKTGSDDDPETGEVGDEHETNVVLPFPQLGDATVAYTNGMLYTAGSTDPAESLYSDQVAIRRGDAVILLSRSRYEADNGMVLPLEELSRKALDRYDAALAAR